MAMADFCQTPRLNSSRQKPLESDGHFDKKSKVFLFKNCTVLTVISDSTRGCNSGDCPNSQGDRNVAFQLCVSKRRAVSQPPNFLKTSVIRFFYRLTGM